MADLPLEDRRGYVRIRASVCLEGRLVRVYRDTQLDSDTSLASLAQEVVRLLDERIIPRSRELLGTHDDVDGDGKLAVLLTPWLGRLQGGSTSVNGFVRSGDFDEHLEPPFGNRGDILYLNSDLRADSSLVATLTHEYTHAVVCSRRRPVGCRTSGMQTEPDWLNEAIAHVAEFQQEAGWSNLDCRVVAFLERPHGTALAVEDYYRSGLWRDPASRGAAFLFLLWCSERFGERLLSQLVEHPRAGIPKLEAITGERFADLFRQWTIAVAAGQVGPLCLTESLGDCPLKGPRVIEWPADQDSLELDVKGTAAAYVRLPAERSNGRHVAIAADDDAQLQATILVRTSAGR